MATKTISQLTAASTPLTGAELVPIVQSGVTSQTTITEISPKVSSSITPVTVSNTTTQTALVSITLPAASLGDVFQLKAWGTITNSSGSAVTYTFAQLLNTTQLHGSGAISFASNANARKWSLDITIAVDNTSTSSSSHAVSLTVTDGSASGLSQQTSGNGVKVVGDSTSVQNLGVAGKTISFVVTMGTASASANMVCDGYVFTRLR